MKAKNFFYVCAGVLMLAIAIHIGAARAIAQAGSETVVHIAVGDSGLHALTKSGAL